MSRDADEQPRIALAQRLRPLGYALVGVVAFVLFLTWVALQAQTTLASLLNADTTWFNAQTQATIALLGYADTGDEAEYRTFQRNFATLEAFKTARDQVLSGHFAYASVEQELRRGDAHLVALPKTIFVFYHFSQAPYIGRAIAIWRTSDRPITELHSIALKLHAAYATGALSPAEREAERHRIRAISASISTTNQEFSRTIAEGAVAGATMLFVAILVLAGLALTLWLRIARRAVARAHQAEERYRLLFESAPDAIVMVEEKTGRILDANRTAGRWAGKDPATLRGTAYAALRAQAGLREVEPGSTELPADDAATRPVETQTGAVMYAGELVRQAVIRDVSARFERERARRIAAAALANIAEGVVIADAERRIISANEAATRITGYPADALIGARLGDRSNFADGAALSEAVWAQVAAGKPWSGEVLGRRPDRTTYPERLILSAIRNGTDATEVRYYVAVFSDVSDEHATHARLARLASQDPLTGLANRFEFQRRAGAALETARREGTAAAVLFVDMDGFKSINDGHGHAAGDEVLKLTGARIRAELRAADLAARIGGDEFVVLLTGLAARDDARPFAERLLPALSEPFRVAGQQAVLGASIGIAGFPEDGDDVATLVAHADQAMYAAKTSGSGVWHFFASSMGESADPNVIRASDVRNALAQGELRLVFQPIVAMASGRIVAAEALMRWQHKERGEILPDKFIPIAERIGLGPRVDQWALSAVCKQIRAWDQSRARSLRVAVNVSAGWFGHPDFLASVGEALRASAVAPERIVIEITEGAMLRLGSDTEETLKALHDMGVGIAIDDFGTGYASLSYLKLPAIDYLKIDRSFISGLPDEPSDRVITNAVLAMARCLGPTVIAEGVETEIQHELLLESGCALGQGFLYARPLAAEALASLVKDGAPLHGRRRGEHRGERTAVVPAETLGVLSP